MRTLYALAALLCVPEGLSAHGGRTAADGCHFDRKTGVRHCHGTGAPDAARPMTLRSSAGRAFINCSAARAAGAAPVRRGDAGYAAHLDRDGDGVGCE